MVSGMSAWLRRVSKSIYMYYIYGVYVYDLNSKMLYGGKEEGLASQSMQ
jgi:hypothetical protein